MNTRVWTTRDGTEIRIKDMTDSHILNAIRYLERRKANLELAALETADIMNGDMAGYCAEYEAEIICEAEVGEVFDVYDDLVEEAVRRKLVAEDGGRL